MRKSLWLFLLVVLGLPGSGAGPAVAQPAASIEWEIAHRFRLFRNEGHFREILALYQALPLAERRESPAFALEIALEKAAAEKRLSRPLFGDPAAVERSGWAAALLNETCFRAGDRGHYLCRLYAIDAQGRLRRNRRGQPVLGEPFMAPKTTDILARLGVAPPGIASKPCRWTAGAATATAPCGQPVRLQGLPFETDFTLEARLADGSLVARLDTPARARNIFIAGIGDSFASGEGNPDQPAWLSGEIGFGADYSRSSPLPDGRARTYPTRIGAAGGETGGRGQPVWLNTQCHRSLYSQHLRASLALALEQPHLAVSFTGYACTGAETIEGVLDYWEARSDVPDRFRDDTPQLMRLLRDYCASPAPYLALKRPEEFTWRSLRRCETWRSRPPDLVLLSIGGNDIGFARVIAGQTIGHHAIDPPPLWDIAVSLWIKVAKPLSFEDARQLLDEAFPRNTALLHEAFETYLRPAGAAPPAYSLIQTGYPLLTKTGSGTCRASDDGMDVHAALRTKDETGRKGVEFVEAINAKLRTSIEGLGTGRWTFTDRHTNQFAGHALCSPGAPPRADFASRGYDPVISGGLDFPTLFNPANVRKRIWLPYRPDDWRAYRPRSRWIVDPNDGFQTGHFLSPDFPGTDKVQPLIAATLSGAFHPNALGHAATADAVLVEMRRLLATPAPQ